MANYRKSETGRLEEPVFVRGIDPTKRTWRAPIRPSPWERHFELGRLHPGQWMLVGEYKKGGCRARQQAVDSDRGAILGYLERTAPLERWQLSQVTLPDTWCDRQLYMRYLHTLSPEEDVLDRKRRDEVFAAKLAKSKENKARRELEARNKARQEEAEAQTKIRARRRPGQ